ncbi:MAG: protein-L-isoaspartate(D-aspartate) O-methyltransferase [Bryobacterales bacterium]|nr:protein-L-isoaspartate(D-aspartate) O-methyltransferase [Bryobacterales bacterium]MDE0292608.1 protein-L-isoaspartate(D-aspartate) O-methyltransferase [Bryobacterales bacterium]
MTGLRCHWVLVGAVLVACGTTETTAQPADHFTSRREAMVRRQIESRDIRSDAVRRVMRKVPRHLFVPVNLREAAYFDQPLPIGRGQTISQPYIVAFMTDQLDLEPEHKILEIGTGSGYQAAVLAELLEQVFTIEIVEELGRRAERTLTELGYENVQVRIGNGYAGWPEKAPFDRILLTAAPEEIPDALVEQLVPGGRLVAPVGPVYGVQEIIVLDKDRDGRTRRRSVLPVRFVPMVGAPEDELR